MTEITLPFPPSVNTYWRTPRKGQLAGMTLLSVAARKFRADALRAVGPRRRIDGRVSVTIVLNPPDRRRRDLDNFSKGVLDALSHAGVWLDDEQVDRLVLVRGTVGKPGSAVVVIDEVAKYHPISTGGAAASLFGSNDGND